MKLFLALGLIIGSLVASRLPADAESLNFYSGLSSDGTHDSQIHMLTGPIDGPLTNDFSSPATFSAALNGSSAFMVTPHSAWASFASYAYQSPTWSWDDYDAGLYGPDADPWASVSTGPARWISSDPNGGAGGAFTALYAITFNLPNFSSASISLKFAADQGLGTTANNGLFLNGNALAGSGGCNYSSLLTFDNNDVTALLQPGDNILYLYNVNYGGPSGVIFDATVNYTPASVPEPSASALLGLSGLIGLMLHRRRALHTQRR
jgi:hypothetical protein